MLISDAAKARGKAYLTTAWALYATPEAAARAAPAGAGGFGGKGKGGKGKGKFRGKGRGGPAMHGCQT